MTTAPSTPLTVADAVASRLRDVGVRRVYGFPGGGSNLDLIEACSAVDVRWVLTHTEVCAGMMACAEAEITGVPGVLIVGNGPGLASSVNAVAQASLDRTPLVVISDRYSDAEATTSGHQVLDQLGVLAPLVKFSATLDAEELGPTLERALTLATAEPPGPVHLDVQRSVLSAALPESAGGGATRPQLAPDPLPQLAPDPLPQLAIDLLERARRPVILVGLEASRVARIDERLIAIAKALGAAVLTTYKAKGCYPEREARWAGILTGGRIEARVLDAADAILTVGLDPVELQAQPWRWTQPALALRTSTPVNDYPTPRMAATGPLGALLDELESRLDEPGDGFTAAAIAHHRETALEDISLTPSEGLAAWQVVTQVSDRVPEATTFAVDAGAHMFPATMLARPSGPRRFLISNGLASMGFAVPAALGAALARPGELAVALTGDGGMAYTLSELETAVRCGARLLVVVLNDASLSLIRIKHEARGRDREALDFGETCFAELARGLGVAGERVATGDALAGALSAALAQSGPMLIEVMLSGEEYGATLSAIRG